MNEYDIQAKKFLDETKTEVTIRFTGKKKYFDDDKVERNCYSVEFSRLSWEPKYNIKKMFVDFGDSIANTQAGKKPRHYDVLACLTKYDPGSFDNFCGEYGYDTDSIKAKKTYKAVKKEWRDVSRLWNDKEIEQLSEIN